MVPQAFGAPELLRLFEQIPAIIWACDDQLRFTFGGGAALNALDLMPNQLVGVALEDYFGAGPEAKRIVALIRRALEGETIVHEAEWLNVPFESHLSPLRDKDGRIVGVIGIAFDITERRKIEEELVVNRYRLQQASALFHVAHYTIDASDTLQMTQEHRAMLGFPPDMQMVTYADLLARVHPQDRQNAVETRRLALAKREPYMFECRVLGYDGMMRHLRFQASFVFDKEGRATRTIGTATDVTEEVERQRETDELLRHDGITGLPNRAYFGERLRNDIAFAEGTTELMALVLLDLDRFSRINDSLGHAAGDAYLRTVAARLRSFQQSSEMAARIGGDEFAILLRGAQRRGDLSRRIDALRALIEEPVVVENRQLHVGVSMGVAIYPYDAPDATLMQKADLALWRARSGGMGRTEYYDLMLGADVASSFRLEHGLHGAIKNAEVVPYYQPIVGPEQHVNGIEALARWNHPEFGVLTPTAFLDVAEESGLVVDMGEQLLMRACEDAASFRKHLPDLRLNINVSSRHLLSPQLIALVRDTLQQSGLPAHALQIEVTEQSLIADVAAARRAIESLRSLGASVVIDDFGTGYNTLTYLKSYQVDGIKLDRAFVKDMLIDRHSRAICEGVMAMARSLDLDVIAEGIESSAQRSAVLELGCKELQGFLFGKPMPARELDALLVR